MRGLNRHAAAAVTVAVCLFSAGRCSAGDRGYVPAKTERTPEPVVTETVEVVKTVTDTVTITQVPESCLLALADLETLVRLSSDLADVGTPQLDIMSNAHEAIAAQDYQRLVELQEEQIAINDRTVETVKDLEVDRLPQLRKHAKQCRDSDKK